MSLSEKLSWSPLVETCSWTHVRIGVFRALSNIKDEDFWKKSEKLKALTIFTRKPHHKRFIEFQIHLLFAQNGSYTQYVIENIFY